MVFITVTEKQTRTTRWSLEGREDRHRRRPQGCTLLCSSFDLKHLFQDGGGSFVRLGELQNIKNIHKTSSKGYRSRDNWSRGGNSLEDVPAGCTGSLRSRTFWSCHPCWGGLVGDTAVFELFTHVLVRNPSLAGWNHVPSLTEEPCLQ